MSDQIDISAKAIETAWQDFCEAGSPNGHLGDIDLYDIDGMFETAQAMHELTVAIRTALDAAEASDATKATIIDDQLNRMAQLEQDLHEAHEALNIPNRYAYKCGIAFGKASAEAEKARAVDAERERCAAVVLSYCGTLNDGRPYYIDLDSTDTDKMFAAIRTGAKP